MKKKPLYGHDHIDQAFIACMAEAAIANAMINRLMNGDAVQVIVGRLPDGSLDQREIRGCNMNGATLDIWLFDPEAESAPTEGTA